MSVDAVYTYVDGDDAAWRRRYRACVGDGFELSDIRFRDHGELILSIQLLLLHCNWVRRIYVVTAASLRPTTAAALRDFPTDRIIVVPQSDLIDVECFNSCTIEARLFKLPGITELFMYLNDDMAFGRPVKYADFVADDGTPWLDCSAVSGADCNLAHVHCRNAVELFQTRYKTMAFPLRTPHVPALVSTQALRKAFDEFPEIQTMDPVRTARTINPQVLAALVGHRHSWGRIRTGAFRTTLSRALVESEQAGLKHIVDHAPHVFCVNGIDAESEERYGDFCAEMVQKSTERKRTGMYPPVVPSWTAEQNSPTYSRAKGDDRRAVPLKHC